MTEQAQSTTFMLIADPQFGIIAHQSGLTPEEAAEKRARGMPVDPVPKFEHWDTEKRRFTAAIKEANRMRPDFVVICGDMVMKWDNEAQRRDVRQVATLLDSSVPLHWVPGNHDVGIDFNVPDSESLAAYRAAYGDDYFSFTSGPAKFVVINSAILYAPENVMDDFEAQFEWLRAELDAPLPGGVTQKIVLAHHPPFLENIDEEDGILNLPLPQRRRLMDLLAANEVAAFFTGHTHMNVETSYGPMQIVASGSISFSRIGYENGYRIVNVGPDSITHSYYEVEER